MKKLILCISIFFIIVTLALFETSCKKGPGSGGRATIKGKVWTRKHDIGYTVVLNEYNSTDEPVYIIYGDEINYGDKVSTNYNGEYEFQYLRKGSYKIYVYSNDSAAIHDGNATAPKVAVVKEISITGKKETVDAGTLIVLH